MKKFASTRRINNFFIGLDRCIKARHLYFYISDYKGFSSIIEDLYNEGILKGYKKNNHIYKIYPRYASSNRTTFSKIKFISKPGHRIFIRYTNFLKMKHWNTKVLGFVRTRLGILSIKDCMKFKIGGELLILIF